MENGRSHTPPSSAQPDSQRPPVCRGVRGATTVAANDPEAILAATRELLYTMVQVNDIEATAVASAYFTTTLDLTAIYPAVAARQLGWFDVPLLCGHEMDVPNGLPLCVRILLHWNTPKTQGEIIHVYLRDAKSLRPDRGNVPPVRPRQISQVEAAVKFLAMTL